jgi:hypothetical protein
VPYPRYWLLFLVSAGSIVGLALLDRRRRRKALATPAPAPVPAPDAGPEPDQPPASTAAPTAPE